MYITINDVIDEKRINLSYPIKCKDGPWGPAGKAPLSGPWKSQLLACLATMFSIGYRDL